MPEFKLKSQEEIDENYQGINLSKFAVLDGQSFSQRKLIDLFLHSKSFTEESRREIIKNHTGEIPFLRQAFEIDFVKLSDFKKLDKNGVIQFLNDYAKQDDWGDTDGGDFVVIKDKFIEVLKNAESDNFYLISKDWFDENDKKLRHEENWIYIYYFLILWVEDTNNILTLSEWTYD